MLRSARPDELDAIYRLGFDAWNEGLWEDAYLHACQHSPKYALGRFFVWERAGGIVAACIVYPAEVFGGAGPGSAWAIGSVATDPALRRRGHATELLSGLLSFLEGHGGRTFFLYSDIAPALYERVGFRRFTGATGVEDSVAMVRVAGGGEIPAAAFGEMTMPRYF